MVYNPATDFLGLWRNNGTNVTKLDMPGLDYVVAALARAGLFTLSVSATPPGANQSTTAWLQTTVPSYVGEGTLHLWDPVAAAYAAASAKLFLALLEASAGQNGVSWWTSTGGPPLNTVGNNGDFAIRTDEPGGIFGPKAAGAWPGTAIPGSVDTVTSVSLDNAFGAVEGSFIVRGAAVWSAFAIGAANTIAVSSGVLPQWETLSALLDAVFGGTQGSLLYRDAALWNDLAPGVANQVLASGGPGANPAWAARAAEFPSGTVMVFQQSAAPPGWTKQTALNDYGLRITSGAVTTTPGSAFSTVFAQTTVGNHALTQAEMPSHAHPYLEAITTSTLANPGGSHAFLDGLVLTNTNSIGGDGPHSHPINLTLAYTDVIIASKN